MHIKIVNCSSRTVYASQRASIVVKAHHLKAASQFLGQRGIFLRPLPSKRHQRTIHNATTRTTPIQASFFGVGAPEAVLVVVVALVLFGPKGLAQAAKSIGQTLKAFAPTIRELTQVSTELKSTLEEEIGLNDLRDELQRPFVPEPRPARPLEATTTAAESTQNLTPVDDTLAKMVDPEIERKRAEAASAAWGGAVPAEQPVEQQQSGLGTMSIEELEAELKRRKEAASASSSE